MSGRVDRRGVQVVLLRSVTKWHHMLRFCELGLTRFGFKSANLLLRRLPILDGYSRVVQRHPSA